MAPSLKLRKKSPLYLKVHALRAADLFLGGDRHKSVNASVVAKLNSYEKRCRRRLHTSNPSWDYTFVIPLNFGDCSDILVLTVWNRGARSRTYMGEVRLQLSDLFGDNELKTPATWYKLYSSESRHEFVTGSLLLSFELTTSRSGLHDDASKSNVSLAESAGEASGRRMDESRRPPIRSNSQHLSAQHLSTQHLSTQHLSSHPSSQHLSSHPSSQHLSSHPSSQHLSLSVLDDKTLMFQQWIDTLMIPEKAISVHPNEQGFYSNSHVNYQVSGGSDVSDIESLVESSLRLGESTESPSTPSIFTSNHSEVLHLDDPSIYSGSSAQSDSEASSVASNAYLSDSGLYNKEFAISGSKKPKSSLRRKMADTKYHVANRKVEGVLFLEIVSCSDLPPIKNFTRTSFDMDPFVVVTYGKKSFRTSWKHHTLNPVYNERLAFEVLRRGNNYDIQFSVLDKDRFSYNDQVAEFTTSIRDLIEIAKEPAAEDSEAAAPDSGIGESGSDAPSSKLKTAFGSATDLSSFNPGIQFADDPNHIRRHRKKFIRKKSTISFVDTSLFKTLNLNLKLKNEKLASKHKPLLKVRARFITYETLRRDFWRILLEQYNFEESSGEMDYIELISFLDTLACNNSDEIVAEFFKTLDRSTWGGDKITHAEIVDCLEDFVTKNANPNQKIFEVDRCPICGRERLSNKVNIDIITHVAICTSKDWSIVNKLLSSSYVTPQLASRRWFSKALIKLTYGKYKLGSNNANILVQDRSTGLILEEKMSITVRLGIRLLYRGLDKAKSKRIRILLQKLSVKQGIKFDSPSSARDIPSFISFHKLNMDDCLISDPTKYKTFNDFFYRKLKPGARPIEAPQENSIAVSPADCRCTTFETVDQATEFWIKGRNFTIAKLFNGNFNDFEKTDLFKSDKCSIGIFRLAPQDYHRFHSPVAGKIGPMKFIEGEYYTVNPMAIRSDLDVYGENVRVIVPIETENFGTVIMVAIGAMMVGSTIITVKEGQEVQRGDEVGYFKFGGSTVLLLFSSDKFIFDSDLVNNSTQCVETLVRVGQSIGHAPEVAEYEREYIDFSKQPKDFKLNVIRVITGGDVGDNINLQSWESKKLQINPEDVDELMEDESEEEGESGLDEFDESDDELSD